MFIIALLLCAVIVIVAMLLAAIGNGMVNRAHVQMVEMYAERIEHLDRFEQVESPPAHNDPAGYDHRRNVS